MSRAARLLELMDLLRQHRAPVTGQTLSERLGVSLRTLYRDIATLQGQGADIEGEPGLGYVLRPGFTLPPMMFTADELEALVLGSRWVAARGADERLGQAAERALAKISGVLPAELRDHLDSSALMVVPPYEQMESLIDPAELRLAIRNEQKLTISYLAEDGAATERVVWPFGIGFFERKRVVMAWCELRQDFRTFRMDRIQTMLAVGQRYPRRRGALLKDWESRRNTEHG